MSDLLDEQPRGPLGQVRTRLVRAGHAMRLDLTRLHTLWMELVFPRGFAADQSVIEARKPGTTRGVAGYRLWAAVGALLLALVYPLFVLGLATRFYSRRIDRVTASLGLLGVALVSLLVWAAFTAVTYVSPIAYEGVIAVGVAGGVATVSGVLALVFTRWDGRVATVAVGYPFGMTAIFLPPVVAALYSPTLAAIVFPGSESLAIWLLDYVLYVGGIAAFIRTTFELEGLAYVGMWFGLAVPTGWVLGILVTYAIAVRGSSLAPTPPGAGPRS